MAVDNTAIGSALIIPDNLLKDLTKVDDKIKQIQDTSRATANVFNNSFASMSAGLKTGLINELQQVINQLGQVNTLSQGVSFSAQNMGSGLSTAAQGATNFGTSITGVVEDINRMIGQLQQTGQVGPSSLMAAKLAADKLMEALQFKNGGNIAVLKDEINNINKTLKDTEAGLSRAEQQGLVERKRLLQEELKEAERTQNERAVNLQRVLDRMMRTEQSYQRQVQQNNKKTADQYKAQNYSQNTTYSGAMSFADNANTINRRTQAIKYLTEARNALSKTDAEYISKLAQLNAKIKELNAANRQAVASSQELGNSHRRLMDTAGQLQRAFALVFSVSQIRGYIDTIAKVRGEFELQQRSLEAILQNKTEADTIFNKTVAMAVKSPFQIKELVSYTKQLAAYRIESDKLYDTTYRLANVSAGLGVDMQRLILAYGQVKAAAYLRGTEVRQFTEAGINLYGELQAYFKEVRGEAYTTAQIVDMISKRQVTFEDVEQIFKRISDQGGIFYRMQEIQAETLQGKIANFKDSVDIMMNEIGKDNEGLFKGAIDSATALMGHWETVMNVGKALAGVIISLTLSSKLLGGSFGFAAQRAMVMNKGFVNASVGTALLEVGMKKASAAFTKFKLVFAGALPLMGIMAALELFGELVKVTREYNENIRKADKDFFSAQVSIRDIKETSKTDVRKALDTLVKEMNNKGYEITIPVNMTDEQAKEKFESYLAEYEHFLEEKLAIDYRYAENKKKGWLVFDDDIDTDMEEAAESAGKLVSKGQDIRVVLEKVNAETKTMTESQSTLFGEMMKGPREGEELIDYYLRVADALDKMGYSATVDAETYNSYTEEQRKMQQLVSAAAEYRADLQEVKDEIKGVFGEFNKKRTEQEKKRISQFIDIKANEKGWDAWIVENIKKSYGINVHVDKKNAQKQIDYLDDMIQKTIGDKTYKLHFATDKTFFDKLADAVDDAGKIVDAAGTWNKIINSKGKVTWGFAKQDTNFISWYRNVFRKSIQNKPISDTMELSDFTMRKYAEHRQEMARKTLNAYNLTSKGDDKKAKEDAKAQRDILPEQISLLKEMQERYEKLREYIGDDAAAKNVKSAFAEALDYVKMPQSIKDSFVPSKEGLVKAYDELLATIPKTVENFKKRSGLEKSIAQLKIEIDQEHLKKQMDETKKNIDAMFSGLDLHQKLIDAGLSEAEVQQLFPGLAKTLNDVQKGIEDEYAKRFPKGEYKIKGTKENEQYTTDLKKLDEQRIKENENLIIELTKAYKTQLSDQLQLDKWYYEEKAKIAKANMSPELAEGYNANLKKKYDKQTAENTWKEFQNSDFYIRIFENLDTTSTRVLETMKEKLASLRGSLNSLSPEQLKQVVDQMEKVNSKLIDKNPFKGLNKGIKEFIKYAKQRKQLNEDYVKSLNKEDELKKQSKAQNDIVIQKETEYNEAVKLHGVNSEQAILAKVLLNIEKDKLKTILGEAVAQGKITENKRDQILAGEAAERETKQRASKIGGYIGESGDSIKAFYEMLNDWGIDEEIPDELLEISDGLGQIDNSISQILSGKVISGTINLLGGIGKSFGGIFGWGTKDKKLEKRIQDLQRQIEDLQRAYEKLKKAMDEAWSITSVNQTSSAAVRNIREQNERLQKMINAERDKKKSDAQKIKEYQNQIEDNLELIKEIQGTVAEEAGGFGSNSNYKTAAQEFADAWVEAFGEGSDALAALNQSFEDLVKNLIKKQVALRISNILIDKVMKPLDNMLTEQVPTSYTAKYQKEIEKIKKEIEKYKDAGKPFRGKVKQLESNLKLYEERLAASYDTIVKDLTPEDILAWVQQLKDGNFFEGLNGDFSEWGEAWKKLQEMLGGNSGDLSKLQQGIQSITESTGSALESLLNSIRFFVSQQTTDISAIRNLLQQSINNIDVSASTDTPMLTELRVQTTILRNIYSKLDSVVRISGHPKQGAGIKVFID